MKAYLNLVSVVVCSVFLAGCGHQTPPPIPKAIPVVESVVPRFVEVDRGIEKSLSENARLADKVKENQKIVQDQKLQIKEVLAKAEKIKLQSEASELISKIDAANLVDQLKKVAERNEFLEGNVNELLKLVTNQELTLKTTKTKSTETLEKLLAKESEANALRSMVEAQRINLEIQNDTIKDLTKDLDKKQVEAAKAGVYKNWVIGLVSAFIAWLVIKNILMIWFPQIKFRI